MKKLTSILAFAAFAWAAAASAAATPGVDNAYRVTGDPQAAPIQAFSVGASLYLQLQNVHEVPAPFSPGGQPLQYRIYGPYIVLPVMPQVILHYGNWTAYVTAAGTAPGSRPMAVVTRPVNAMDPEATAPPPPPVATASAFSPAAALPYAKPTQASGDAVVGEISTPGAAPQTLPGGAGPLPNAVPIADADIALNQLPSLAGGIVLIKADGTVAGARAAEHVMQQCIDRQAACRIQYSGAPAGDLTVEKTP